MKVLKTIKTTVFVLFTGLILLFSQESCYYDNEEELYPFLACDTTSVGFSADILPMINNQCINCHQAPFASGGVDLGSYAEIKIVADNGRLYGSLIHDNAYSAMPQGSQKWNQCDLAKMRIWIEQGALEN